MLDAIKIIIGPTWSKDGAAIRITSRDGHAFDLTLLAKEVVFEDHRDPDVWSAAPPTPHEGESDA